MKVAYQGRNVSQKQFVTTYAGRHTDAARSAPAVVAAFFGPMSLALSPDGATSVHSLASETLLLQSC
jgi:hypothetical protein